MAFVTDEPAAAEVSGLLRAGDAAITSVNLAEVVDVLTRRYEVPVTRTRPVLEGLLGDGLALRPTGARESWLIGELRARHYHRARRPVSLADCALLAAAAPGEAVATSDPQVVAVAALEGIRAIPLLNSRGRRPESR